MGIMSLAVKAARAAKAGRAAENVAKAAQVAETVIPRVAEALAPIERAAPLTVPARAARSIRPIEAYHATPHRFTPEVKLRNPETGAEFYQPSALDRGPGLEVVKDFPLGRFRADRMGTGAGAQNYGAGSYAAEMPNEARTYRDLSAYRSTIGGVPTEAMYADLIDRADRASIAEGRPLYDRATLLEGLLHRGDTMDVENELARDPNAYSPDVTDWFNRDIRGKFDAPGALYKLNIDVDPSQMLSWNTPVADQPQVRTLLDPLLQQYDIPEADLAGKYPLTGGDLYHKLKFRSDVRPQGMADILTGAGIPGIRYDASWPRPNGDRSQNYVVMNPELIDIMKRYRVGGAVTEGNY